MIIIDSRFPIRNGGAYRADNTIQRKDRVNFILVSGFLVQPNVRLTKKRFHHSFLSK